MTAPKADIAAFFHHSNQVVCETINLMGVEVTVVREDLNHPVVQGNKLRKLKYNFLEAKRQQAKTLVTFGGAYSNHLVATAYAAQKLGFDSMGVVRGDELENIHAIWSETLYQCQKYGMELVFVSRAAYRLKEQAASVKAVLNEVEQPFVIPEGGSNNEAVKGVAELIADLPPSVGHPSHVICPVGTGGTLAGIIQGVANRNWTCKVIGVAVLKGLHGVNNEVNQWLGGLRKEVDWQIEHGYHCGGYAKSTPELAGFCIGFSQKHGFELDKVYNSKSFYALAQMIKKSVITPENNPMIVHTGGLQGGVF